MLVHQVPLQDVVEVLTTEVVPGGQDLVVEMIVARLEEALRQGEDGFAFVFVVQSCFLENDHLQGAGGLCIAAFNLLFCLNNGQRTRFPLSMNLYDYM